MGGRASARAEPAEAIGEAVELQPIAGAMRAVADQRNRISDKARPRWSPCFQVFIEQLDAVVDRGDRSAQLMAESGDEQLQNAHLDQRAFVDVCTVNRRSLIVRADKRRSRREAFHTLSGHRKSTDRGAKPPS